MLKRVIVYFIAPVFVVLIILLMVLVFNTLSDKSTRPGNSAISTIVLDKNDLQAAEHRLSEAIRIKTLSHELTSLQGKKISRTFLNLLRTNYPNLHSDLKQTVINEQSIIYHWPAPVSSNKSRPVLLLAHYDVVPVQGLNWQHPGFSGFNDGQAIWGRGSLDNKSSLLAMLEAIEILLRQGHSLNRDVYLAFGHDEESGGELGAKKIAEYFISQGLKFDMILDEGLVVTEGVIDLVQQPVALIGISEKGLLNLELSLEQKGGHASMPGKITAVGQMSRALQRLEENPLPARLTYPVVTMLSRLAHKAKVMNRLVLSNLWLFRYFVIKKFNQSPATHAAVNTTIVATQISASNKINVLPTTVTANLNIRILPGDSIDSVQQHVRDTIGNPRIRLRVVDGAFEPAPMSMIDHDVYRQLERSILQVYPDALVAPGLVLAATDSRHYRSLTERTYRFMPLRLTKQDLSRIHGENERILIQDYHRSIQFYWQLLMNIAVNQAEDLSQVDRVRNLAGYYQG
ncbi:hypothetical protein MNBD_GAMMA21-936 [hydrothermal vent metagenome]|uniref:Peptidase M20 dimerisation domain-containing protein n=1 Tax=hydrothermal vent metagenome TaxID=652676 RepID=A0A3B0ZIJ4_9ZZZZ